MEAAAKVTVHEVQELLAEHRDGEALGRCERALASGISDRAVAILRIRALVALDRIPEAAAAAIDLGDPDAEDRVLRRWAAEVDQRLHAERRALELHADGELVGLLSELERTERDTAFQLAGRSVLAQLDDTAWALCAYAAALNGRNRFDAAGEVLERAEALAADDAERRAVAVTRAAGLRRRGAWREAETMLSDTERRYGRSSHLDLGLAAVLGDLAARLGDPGMLADAQRRGRRAYAQDPGNDRVRALLNRLNSIARTLETPGA